VFLKPHDLSALFYDNPTVYKVLDASFLDYQGGVVVGVDFHILPGLKAGDSYGAQVLH